MKGQWYIIGASIFLLILISLYLSSASFSVEYKQAPEFLKLLRRANFNDSLSLFSTSLLFSLENGYELEGICISASPNNLTVFNFFKKDLEVNGISIPPLSFKTIEWNSTINISSPELSICLKASGKTRRFSGCFLVFKKEGSEFVVLSPSLRKC